MFTKKEQMLYEHTVSNEIGFVSSARRYEAVVGLPQSVSKLWGKMCVL